ncbi:LuxR family transcriptional regulator [Shewanella avicenniae]|uniref:LuxR family transcriptional regulator n=1 Tax=Shewanella avicenniae TaxID=2814294 RepID=A0ABX7QQY3_9GAMM|nr:LuxR C-terminal-related transcriptional regulator [Shewanella avicenniae]QSX33819.1 LuxR family transcriptional regulator [Shewanella avicenniae]
MKDWLLITLLSIITLLNLLDVLSDLDLGVPAWHIVQESLLVTLSGLGAIYISSDLLRRTRKIRLLATKLKRADHRIGNISTRMKAAREEYTQAVQQQFEQWGLTRSEQEVALLLLKGLSFREIAGVRNTKEKTVRQQASSIYTKAEVDGRHSFCAWFMEDFIQPANQDVPEQGMQAA